MLIMESPCTIYAINIHYRCSGHGQATVTDAICRLTLTNDLLISFTGSGHHKLPANRQTVNFELKIRPLVTQNQKSTTYLSQLELRHCMQMSKSYMIFSSGC